MAHKRLSIGLLAVVVVFVALVLPAILGPGRLSDSSSCSTWDSADHAGQVAYARLFLREHGPLFSGATTPQGVVSAITGGCAAAAVNNEADTVSVIQAIEGRY
jgi:membrane-associated PAP2 superfamily phosphatase